LPLLCVMPLGHVYGQHDTTLEDYENITKMAEKKLEKEQGFLTVDAAVDAFHDLSSDDARRIFEAFHHLDNDASGYLGPVECEGILADMGFDRSFVKTFFNQVDHDNDGRISYREFFLAEFLQKPNKQTKRMLLEAAHKYKLEHNPAKFKQSEVLNIKEQMEKMKKEEAEALLKKEAKVAGKFSEDEIQSLLNQGVDPVAVVEDLRTHDKKDVVIQELLMSMAKLKIRKHSQKAGRVNFRALLNSFDFFDMNKNHRICQDEFKMAMFMIGVSLSERTVNDIFALWDKDGDGLDYSEFSALLNSNDGKDNWIGTHGGWKFKRIQMDLIH